MALAGVFRSDAGTPIVSNVIEIGKYHFGDVGFMRAIPSRVIFNAGMPKCT
jgi:hypothetical protein